jgi:hypothetical protein
MSTGNCRHLDHHGQRRWRRIPLGGFVFPSLGCAYVRQLRSRGKCVRASIGRQDEILKGALLFFSEKNGVQSCTVRDVTNRGAGIRVQHLRMLPLDFALSFDGFRTVRKCRLVWRQEEFIGVAFES